MYIPEYHRIDDPATSAAFMRANPFAILISDTDDGPFATHLPMSVGEIDGRVRLRGHIAKANPHCKLIEREQESLIIFHGPHAYVSPSLYENRESVPTWNYAAVHVYGRTTTISAEYEVREVLLDLISQFDAAYQSQWLSLGDQYQSRMLNHIVAFEVTAARVETKFKLSQNRTKAEQENVIQALSSDPDSAVSGTAALMRQQRLGLR